MSNIRIAIERVGDNIATYKDFSNIDSRGEISHILAELELIKQELLVVFKNWED